MKINWYIRFKNPVFVFQLALSIFGPILAYAGISYEDLNTWQKVGDLLLGALKNPYVLGMIGISVYSTITDPTVKSWLVDSKFSREKIEPTDPDVNVVIKGEQNINDESKIKIDNRDGSL